jgi:hypothetical protein
MVWYKERQRSGPSGMKLHGATPAQFALEDFVQFGHLRMISQVNQTGPLMGLRRQKTAHKINRLKA